MAAATCVGAGHLQVIAALQQLHAAGIFHLDIKPANILISRPLRPSHVRFIPLPRASPPPPEKDREKVKQQQKRQQQQQQQRKGRDEEKEEEERKRKEGTEKEVQQNVEEEEDVVCCLIDMDSAQEGIAGSTLVHAGGTSRAFTPPEELSLPLFAPADASKSPVRCTYAPAPEPLATTQCCPQQRQQQQQCWGGSESKAVERVKEEKLAAAAGVADGRLLLVDGEKKDVWALGCVIAIAVLGRHPFIATAAPAAAEEEDDEEEDGEEQQQEKELEAEEEEGREEQGQCFTSEVEYLFAAFGGELHAPSFESAAPLSRSLRRLLRGMLQPDPQKRLSLAEVAAHPWLCLGPREAAHCSSKGEEGREGVPRLRQTQKQKTRGNQQEQQPQHPPKKEKQQQQAKRSRGRTAVGSAKREGEENSSRDVAETAKHAAPAAGAPAEPLLLRKI